MCLLLSLQQLSTLALLQHLLTRRTVVFLRNAHRRNTAWSINLAGKELLRNDSAVVLEILFVLGFILIFAFKLEWQWTCKERLMSTFYLPLCNGASPVARPIANIAANTEFTDLSPDVSVRKSLNKTYQSRRKFDVILNQRVNTILKGPGRLNTWKFPHWQWTLESTRDEGPSIVQLVFFVILGFIIGRGAVAFFSSLKLHSLSIQLLKRHADAVAALLTVIRISVRS